MREFIFFIVDKGTTAATGHTYTRLGSAKAALKTNPWLSRHPDKYDIVAYEMKFAGSFATGMDSKDIKKALNV